MELSAFHRSSATRQGPQPDSYLLLAGATLVEGVYAAMMLDVSNEFVRDALRTGISAAIVIRAECPVDALDWLCHNANFYNSVGGSATSWLELLNRIPDIEGSWKETWERGSQLSEDTQHEVAREELLVCCLTFFQAAAPSELPSLTASTQHISQILNLM